MYSNVLKIGGGVLLALVITTFSIDASDTLSGKGGTMLASLVGTQAAICPEGMISVSGALTFACVDLFEVSPDEACPVRVVSNQFDTEINLSKSDCRPASVEGENPWRFVDRNQAAVLCTRAGKRLPSAEEWYQFALGTPTEKCTISGSGANLSGTAKACVSAAGVFDTVGNVWEWVSDDVIDGKYQSRELPETGYVSQVDKGGVATVTSDTESKDGYFWSNKEGAFGIIRGGFYGSRSDAGNYTVHAETLPTFSGAAVGFRCVK